MTNTFAAPSGDLFDPSVFSAAVRRKLERDDMSYRQAAPAVPCSPATLNRVARGKTPDIETYLRVSRWLAAAPEPEPMAERKRARYRHARPRAEFEVIGTAELQQTVGIELKNGDRLVIYRGDGGKMWAREYSEFHDGQIVPAALHSPMHAPGEG